MNIFRTVFLGIIILGSVIPAAPSIAQKKGKGGFTQSQHKKALNKHLKEIEQMANNKHCQDPNEFAYAPLGSKPCGGPKSYIVYSKKIDTKNFLNKLSQYNMAEDNYNKRWGLQSDCAVAPVPTSLTCVNNRPVLQYNEAKTATE